MLGAGKVDLTIGSALDLFGGEISFQEVTDWQKRENAVHGARDAAAAASAARGGGDTATARDSTTTRLVARLERVRAGLATENATLRRAAVALRQQRRARQGQGQGQVLEAAAAAAMTGEKGARMLAVIFDTDGTLVDTESLYHRAFNRTLAGNIVVSGNDR